MAGRFSVEAVFKAVDKISAPVRRMQNRVGKLTRSMSRRFSKLNKKMAAFGKGAKRAGLAVVAGLAIASTAMASVVGTGAQFEQAIADVGAVSLQTREQIRPLEDMAIRLGKTTKFTATEAARAMETMKKAGFSNAQVMAGVPAILDAAAASGLEIAEVANHVSNALKGMGLEASQAAMVADVLALASSRTNSTIGSLGEGLKNVASTARQLKIPFTEVTAAVALLQDVGLDASVSGSALNTMLTKMAKPPKAVAEQMRRFGISFKDAKGDMLPFQDVIQNISKAAKKSGGNLDQVAFLADLVGLRGQKAASNLAKLFETGKLKKLIKQLDNAEGSAKKMADLRMDTTIGQYTLLQSAIDGVKTRIFNMNSGPLKNMITRMKEWVGENEALIATNIGGFLGKIVDNIDAIVRTAKQVAGVITIFIAFSAAIKAAMVVMGVLELATAAYGLALSVLGGIVKVLTAIEVAFNIALLLFNGIMAVSPIGAFILAIGLLAALGAAVILAWNPVKKFFSGLADKIGGVISAISSGASKFGEFFGFTTPDMPAAPKNVTGALPDFSNTVPGVTGESATGAGVVSPQERITRSIDEQRRTNTSEITIRDQTGRAEVTGGAVPGLVLQSSGGF